MVVGRYLTPKGLAGFLLSGQTFETLPSKVEPNSLATAINQAGVAVGAFLLPDLLRTNAAAFRNGVLEDLGNLSDRFSTANAINDLGVVVGWGAPSATVLAGSDGVANTADDLPPGSVHAVRFGANTVTDLGTLPGHFYSYATELNNAGVIVGYSSRTGNAGTGGRAFKLENGIMTDLGAIGGVESGPFAINDSGVVVGYFNNAGSANQRAFVHRGGSMIDLSLVSIGLPAGVRLTEARDINAAGQIVANGSDNRAYLLTPTTGMDGSLVNASVRTNLPAGQTLTMGFVTSGTRNLLVRGVGPTLGSLFGLANAHPDPRLAVFNGQRVQVAEVDDWFAGTGSSFASVGAFPLVERGKDAAMLVTGTGPTTVQVSGTGAGIVLAELYDMGTPAGGVRVVNFSARNQVGTGDNILINGFVITGGARRILIRGIGPALRDNFGIMDALEEPVLEVHQAIAGQDVLRARVGKWDANLATLFAKVGAFALKDGSKDAALELTLPPGAYTVQLSGANQAVGDGLVEIYEVR